MKKIVSLLCSLSLLASLTSITAFAETPAPVDIDAQAYAALMKKYVDRDDDGVIDESELEGITSLSLDLEGINDISWMSRLKNCHYLTLEGGTLTDFSVLKQMPKLRGVRLKSVPLTDISFVKDMNLFEFELEDVDQISLEQRLEVIKVNDLNIECGFADKLSIYPFGIFLDHNLTYKFDDEDIASIARSSWHDAQVDVYGKKVGATTCHIYLDGEEIRSCNVAVSPLNYFSPPLNSKSKNTHSYNSFYYGDRYAVIEDGTLYGINGGQYNKYFDDVKYISTTHEQNAKNDYISIDLVLKNDGTLILNDKVIEDIKFDYIIKNCAVTTDGTLYSVYPYGTEPVIVKVGTKCENLMVPDYYYKNKNGELIWYRVKYGNTGMPIVTTRNTGITNPFEILTGIDSFILDDEGVLWRCEDYSYFSKKKIAENVIDIGYYPTTAGYSEKLYIVEGGKSYSVYDGKEYEIVPVPACVEERPYLQDGCFYIHEYEGIYGNDESDLLINWFITAEDILTIDLAGRHFAISDVEQVIGEEYVKEQEKGYVWFIRTDGSVWRYCFETQEAVQMSPTENAVAYDVNCDGSFNVADLVALQRWLLGNADATLGNWRAADLNGDMKVDVFDLCMMRKAIIAKN